MSTVNTNLSSDVVQELINARAERLLRMSPRDITRLIHKALDAISPGSSNALQGVDADESHGDGITFRLWEQGLSSLEMTTELVFPGWDGASQPVPAVCHFEISQMLMAGRVARAILVVNGFVNLSYDEITELHRRAHDDNDHICSGPRA